MTLPNGEYRWIGGGPSRNPPIPANPRPIGQVRADGRQATAEPTDAQVAAACLAFTNARLAQASFNDAIRRALVAASWAELEGS